MRPLTLSPRLEQTHRLLSRGGARLLVRLDWESSLPLDAMLAGAPLDEWGTSVPHALSGRGPVQVLSTARGEIVAKRLRRGGLAGALLRNTFFDARRPLREAEAAELLCQRGVRTPPVVVARIMRRGAGLRIETATARVGGVDLVEACRGGPPLATLATALGLTLREAHGAGLRHRDLQAKNLLVPAGFPGPGGSGLPDRLVILDLDRCRVSGPLSGSERRRALVRLGRSLVKHGILPSAESAGDRRFRAALWACRPFARAYGSPEGPEAAFVAELGRRVALQISTHSRLWPGR